MRNQEKSKMDSARISRIRSAEKLPPKGTAARMLLAAGLWSQMTRDELDKIKREVFGDRKSAK